MTPTPQTRLGERLVAAGKLSERDLDRALQAQEEMGDLLGRVLVRLGVVSDLDIAQQLSAQLGVPLIAASDFPAEALVIEGLASEFLLHHQIIPLSDTDGILRVAMTQPQDAYTLKALRLASGRKIQPALALESEVSAALTKLYLSEQTSEDEALPDRWNDDEFVEHLKDLASEAPVIRLVNQIIASAIDRRASDIHIEPEAKSVIDDLLLRYIEAITYQSVAENLASEQSARMVAMKSASDNAKNVIGELRLAYNKARQAAITKELSEIVSGAAAV